MSWQVWYNGIAINTVGSQVHLVRKEQHDGPNYTTTQTALYVRGIYNPAATAYVMTPRGPTAVSPNSGIVAPTTDVAIRAALMLPRRQLVYTVGGVIELMSPWCVPGALGVMVDDDNGPIPTDCHVTAIPGGKTFLVEYVIATKVNETRLVQDVNGNLVAPVILSHTWDQSEDVNEDFFSTVTTKGKAILSTTALQAFRDGIWQPAAPNVARQGGDPDNWRQAIFREVFGKNNPAVLPNFKRYSIHCDVDKYNNCLNYVIIDREQPVNLVGPNITRIECSQGIKVTSPDPFAVTWSTIQETARNLKFDSVAGAIRAGVKGFISGGKELAFNPVNLPHAITDWTMKLWGNNQCTKAELLSAAEKILVRQVQNIKRNKEFTFTGATQCRAEFDLIGKSLRVVASVDQSLGARVLSRVAGTLQANLQGLGNLIDGTNMVLPTPEMWGDESVPGVFVPAAFRAVLGVAGNIQKNPVPPGDSISRGNYIGGIRTQVPT